MATHDYVIANGTGAAVRSDLNNALAAIVSNNSSSSEPATTYAYQFWADTNANVLKIRNSANNAWITLRELDGTMLIEDGSASTPGLAFADDINTGIFSPAADQIAFATGGAERLEIGSSEVVFNDPSNDVDFRVESNGDTHMLFVDAGNDRVGIATSSPGTDLDVNNGSANCTVRARTATGFSSFLSLLPNGSGTGVQLASNADSSAQLFNQLNSHLAFGTNNTEAVRIDSAGKVGIGQSAPAYIVCVDGAEPIVDLYNTNATSSGSHSVTIQAYGATSTFWNKLAISGSSLELQTFGATRASITNDGLTFNGDTAAANALDDYEEGTFTGRFNNQDDDATVSHGNQTGYYVKVGSLVHFSLYFDDIDVSSVGSISNASIYGLPFTSLGSSQHYSVVNIIHNTILTSAAGGYVNTNSTKIFPTDVGTTTTSTFSTGTNKRLMIGGTYRAA